MADCEKCGRISYPRYGMPKADSYCGHTRLAWMCNDCFNQPGTVVRITHRHVHPMMLYPVLGAAWLIALTVALIVAL